MYLKQLILISQVTVTYIEMNISKGRQDDARVAAMETYESFMLLCVIIGYRVKPVLSGHSKEDKTGFQGR